MKPTRGPRKRYVESSDSEDDRPLKISPKIAKLEKNRAENSSSESDIENYLQRPDKLDLNSEFFNSHKNEVPDFNKIENEIFAGITRLSESDSGNEEEIQTKKASHDMGDKNRQSTSKYFNSTTQSHHKRRLSDSDVESDSDNSNKITNEKPPASPTKPKLTFDQFQNYTRKLEETKKFIETYQAKKKTEENKTDILNLLAAGENKLLAQSVDPADLHSSDFESTDEEGENWEEITPKNLSQVSQELVPKKNVEITIGMPDAVRKKKGVDLLAAMKRRLNRIRKENQILVHKVHLLCWIAHGNYASGQINDTHVLGMALSLLPSEQCYPPDRTDLGYLEQIVHWYKRTIKCVEKPLPKNVNLAQLLEQQISKKEAYDKKMLVLIFVAVLRSLGIQCRLVISLQVEPLRPPATELHSLSAKADEKLKTKSKKATVNTSINKKSTKHIEVKPGTSKACKDTGTGSKNLKENDKKSNEKSLKPADTTKKTKEAKNSNLSVPKSEKRTKSADTRSASDKKDNLEVHTVRRSRSATNTKQSTNANKVENDTTEKSKINEKGSKGVQKKDTKNSKKSLESPNPSRTSNRVSSAKLTKKSEHTASSKAEKKESATSKRVTRKSGSQIKDGESEKNKDCLTVPKERVRRAKSTDSVESTKSDNKKVDKKIIKVKLPIQKKKIQQVDGANYSSSDDEFIIPQLDGNNSDPKTRKPNLNQLKRSSNSKQPPQKTTTKNDSENEFEMKTAKPKKPNLTKLSENKRISFPAKQVDVRNDIMSLIKGRIKEQKQSDRNKLVKKKKNHQSSDSDSDYLPEAAKKKHIDSEDDFVPKTKVKRRIPGKTALLTIEEEKKKKSGNDYWVEVFLEAEEKWISADIVFGQVHCVKELYQRATHPVSYVLAWNNDNSLKDVTQRYCENFNTVTRKLRIDAKWWNESIKPFLGRPTPRDKEEDDDLARQQQDQPLPKSIAEYKNHPLYALRRHLLKFEALYPPEPPTLGFIRGEAVYPRGCVFTLHSREIWLKQAKVVKLGEQPYKIVKARPKYDKLSNKMITDQMLEIFGPWQTEDYVPPTAQNGIVPRNAFGNVDLFKPSMLPFGTVHLKLPGLGKVAKKLNIDCAQAVVGFEFHSGWSVPTIDGFVVCTEYEDVLVSAWEKEQEEIEQREQEKIDKRVYGNWKRLIKGLLIRERLKAKYNFGAPSGSGAGKEKKKKTKAPTFATKKRRIQSESDSSD